MNLLENFSILAIAIKFTRIGSIFTIIIFWCLVCVPLFFSMDKGIVSIALFIVAPAMLMLGIYIVIPAFFIIGFVLALLQFKRDSVIKYFILCTLGFILNYVIIALASLRIVGSIKLSYYGDKRDILMFILCSLGTISSVLIAGHKAFPKN